MAIFRIFHGVQGGPSGCRTLFVDIKLKVLPLYELLMLKSNSYYNVNKEVVLDQMDHPGWQFNRICRPSNRPLKDGRQPKDERLRVGVCLC